MPKVVGIKFKSTAKTYYFDPGDRVFELNKGVIVETARGVEYGKVVMLPTEVSEDKIVSPLKPVIRIANEDDEKLYKKLEDKRDDAIKIATEKIEKSGLNMKLVDVEYTFDQSKLIIYFTADGRVDFRELVKELASAFHIRIELRQIGARDECKMLGGLGPCGRACCCSDHMNEYARVSIKMAKNQNLSLNPGKISGLCGRLMCCLSYENNFYAEVNKKMPKMDSEVVLKDGRMGKVCAINQLKESVSVKINENDNIFIAEVPLTEIKFKGKGSAMDDMVVDNLDDDLKSLEGL
ncbi:MAG: stage 0 sporulation family protein [Clostridia bacterium]|nr:stage 0 sporulation family protein [Clostridia bacterium]